MMNCWLLLTLTVLALSSIGYAESDPQPFCRRYGNECGIPGDLGTCKPHCDSDKRACPFHSKDCGGVDCKCCKPKVKQPKCKYWETKCGTVGDTGICKPYCESDERACPIHSKMCAGGDCKCCKPKEKPGQCAYIGTRCGVQGDMGFCRPNCNSDERSCSLHAFMCAGGDCKCCKPKIGTCWFERSACGVLKDYGICKPKCDFGERECTIHTMKCDGDGCKCCKPEYEGTCAWEKAECGDPGNYGVCKTKCAFGERACPQHTQHCEGKGCMCCKPDEGICNKVETLCGVEGNSGVCKAKCEPWERACPVHSKQCDGKGCKCCKPDDEDYEDKK